MDTRGRGYEPSEVKENYEKIRTQFKEDAEKILGDKFNAHDLDNLLYNFNDNDIDKWSKELYDLSHKINSDEKLSEEEKTFMKSKFIGEMTAYRQLPLNTIDEENETEKNSKEYDKGKNCSRCGKLLPSEVIYCPYCGNKF